MSSADREFTLDEIGTVAEGPVADQVGVEEPAPNNRSGAVAAWLAAVPALVGLALYLLTGPPFLSLTSLAVKAGCELSEGPCAEDYSVAGHFWFPGIALALGLVALVVLLAMPRTRQARGPQIAASFVAMAGGLWPLAWILWYLYSVSG